MEKLKKASYKIKMNDAIEITIPDNKEMDVLPEDIPLDIVYEDQDVIVVNKTFRDDRSSKCGEFIVVL